MSANSRRRGVVRAGLAATTVLLALGPVALAQEAEEEQLAGYVGTASGAVFSVQPLFPGLLPTGDAPFEVTGGLTATNVKSGGNAFGQASAVYPGAAAANLGPLLGAAADPSFNDLPPYPALVQANQDDGEVSKGASPGPVMRAKSEPGASEAESSGGAPDIPGVFRAAGASSVSRSLVKGSQLVTETVVDLSGVELAAGAITIDSIKSVARATSDGTKATTSGSTVVSGLEIAGQPATIDEKGLSSKGLPLQALQPVLEAAGVTMELTKASGSSNGGTADRVSSGLVVTVANPAAALNPQFVGSRFVISLAPTAVGALASPPFAFDFQEQFPVAAVEPPAAGAAGGGGGGFADVAGEVSTTFDAPASAPTGGGGSSPGAPIAFEPARRAFEAVGGITPTLVLGMLAVSLWMARYIKRYVARFVLTEE